jgi:hypothetical protein
MARMVALVAQRGGDLDTALEQVSAVHGYVCYQVSNALMNCRTMCWGGRCCHGMHDGTALRDLDTAFEQLRKRVECSICNVFL